MTKETQTGTYGSSAADGEAVQPFLFVVLQGNALHAPAVRVKLLGTERVAVGRGEQRAADVETGREGATVHLRLADDRISTQHCEIRRESRGFVLVDLGSKNGTRVNGQLEKQVVLTENAIIEVGRTHLLFRSYRAPASAPVVTTVDAADELLGFATMAPPLAKQFHDARAIARSLVPVLVRGETGTGKELAAAAVHSLSKRTGPFVPVNCGALPASLAASELFGAKKGAFSGATEDRPGLVRAADKGTLFLDEVGDLQADVQAALLRVLQESEVLPLGATRPVKVDVRIVAATHRDLEAMVANGEFRQDLFARLAGYTLRLPPLRTRREDLGLVLSGLIRQRLGPEREVSLRNASVRHLLAAPFEHNVRELEQALASAATLAQGPELDLTEVLAGTGVRPASASPEVRDAELKAKLEAALRAHRGNISAVAAEFGKARMQIQRWLKRFQLDARALGAEATPEADEPKD